MSKSTVNLTSLGSFDNAKIGTKKTLQTLWNVLGKIWEDFGKIPLNLKYFGGHYQILVLHHKMNRKGLSLFH